MWDFRDEVLLYGEVIRRANHLVDVPHRLGCKTFRFLFRFDTVYSTTVQQVFVELL